MPSSTNTILSIQNLSVHFQTEDTIVRAIENLDVQVQAGEVLGIVGESGSGKSVLSLAIMGLLPKSITLIPNGQILNAAAQNILSLKSRKGIAPKMAMIFQEPMTSLNPLHTCGNQISEAVLLHKAIEKNTAKKIVLDLLQEVKIPNPTEAFHKYPHQLSGGQKQRVMIAIALACQPELIICDEPTTALDVTVQKEIMDLLQELQKKRKTAIIFITHDLLLLKNFATNILVMQKGIKVEYADANSIFISPQMPYTKALINCKPTMGKRLKVLPTIADLQNVHIPFEPISETTAEAAAREQALTAASVLIDLKNISLQYIVSKNIFGKAIKTFEALHNINLQIKKGEILGLVGESGCGKSSLGKCLVRLENPSRGTIYLNGHSIHTISNGAYAQQVQIIFQDPYASLNPRVIVGETIKEALDVYGIGAKANRISIVKKMLVRMGLDEIHYYRYPHEFSGGQRQRIGIARALVLNPSLIICDESVSALDVGVQAQVLNLLKELRQEFDLTLLFISHDMSVVNHLCDRVAVMQAGKIVEYNTVHNLFAAPAQSYTKNLLAAIPK